MRRPFASRPLSLLVAACLASLPTLPRAQPSRPAPAEVDVPATSSLELRVTDADAAPLAGVEVVLGTPEGEVLRRATTDGEGMVVLEELDHGYYQVAFRHEGNAYASNRLLLLSPEEEREASFALGGFSARARDIGLAPGQPVPLIGEPAAGVATLDEAYGPTGWEWFRTGEGVAVLVGSGALLVGGIVAMTDDEDERVASPSAP